MKVDFKFDVIVCLNLLDRCDKFFILFSDIKEILYFEIGCLIVVVVFLFRFFVELGMFEFIIFVLFFFLFYRS